MARISADEKKWRAQSDLETLSRASEIQSDRSRMSAVKAVAQAQVAALSKVAGTAKAPSKAPSKATAKAPAKKGR
jgi:hypothetical protein